MTSTRWAIVAAAGSGTRFGGLKQFEELGGRSLVSRALDLFSGWNGVVVALPPGHAEHPAWSGVTAVTGGASRRASVARALSRVPMDADVIAVHDAARPLATSALLDVLEAALASDYEGAVPGRRVTDTVKRVALHGNVVATIPREELRAVQTPQLFRAAALRKAHADAPRDAPAPDDAALLEGLGLRVVVVEWPEDNPKVTVPADLERLRRA